MAPFNPAIKDTQDPNFGGNSRPVDVPNSIRPEGVATNTIMPHGVEQGDLSAQYAGMAAGTQAKANAVGNEGFAELFKEAAVGGDFLSKAGVQIVKKDIEDKVYEVADRERQSYTDLLEKIKAGVGVKNVLDANASEDDRQTPEDIQALPDTLSALQGAKDAGKISGTYYQSRLLAEAKSLRAQYPGFREEIDNAFAKVTGTNPANAYVTSLVQDINRASTAASSNKAKMLTYIRNNLQFPGFDKLYSQYQAGLVSDEDVIKQAAPYEQQKYDLNMRALRFNDNKNTREDQTRIAGDNIDYASGVVVNRAVDHFMSTIGINSTDDVNKLASAEASGNITPKQWTAWGQAVSTAKLQLRTQMIADADRLGYTKAAGGKTEVNKRIDEALKPMDALLDRVYNHDSGGLYSIQQSLKAQNDQLQQKMLNDPKIGPTLQVDKALKDIGGEQNLQQFNMQTIAGKFPAQFQTWYNNMSKTMGSQYNMSTTGVPYTFNDALDKLREEKVNDKELNNATLKLVNKITDKNTPDAVKMNFALAAFDPANRGMISKLNPDGFDSKGNPISGQNAVFTNFTSPEMTKAMHELGKQNPTVWNNYVDWAQNTIANELMNKDIHNIAQIPDNAGVGVSWDPKNHRFFTTDTMTPEERWTATHYGGKREGGSGSSYYNTVNAAVNRMNTQIYNYKRIAEVGGQDVDAFVLKTIADSAGPEALRNVNGIPYNLMRDMGLSRFGAGPLNKTDTSR